MFKKASFSFAKWPHFLALLLLIAAGTLVYSNTFRSPFVYDDINFITRNDPHVHMTDFSWAAIKEAALEGSPRHRYLPNISFAVNYYFGRENPFGYHLVNLGIHLLTGIFLFFLFLVTLRIDSGQDNHHPESSGAVVSVSPEWVAFFGTLLWLVHPVQTNAVTYMCQRMTSMAALFFVLSLLLYVKGRMVYRKNCFKSSVVFFAGCVISGICAVASKENAGTLPIFILLFEWFFFQNFSGLRSARSRIGVSLGLILFIGISVHFLGDEPIRRILASYSRRDFTLSQRVMTEFRVVVYYLSLLVFPHPRRLILDHDYPLSHSLMTPISTIFSLAAIAGLMLAAVISARKHRLASFAILWYLGNLVIESSVIGIEIIYEHRMYLPAMFLYLLFSQMVFHAFREKRAAAGVLMAAALVLGGWAHQRNIIWQTDISFWTDSVQKAPGKARPWQNLAYSLQAAGKHTLAIDNYLKSLAIAPHPVAYFNVGLCYENAGYYMDAAEAYASALKMKYNTPQVHSSLAVALTNIGEFRAAQAHFEQAYRMNPSDSGAGMGVQVLQDFLDQCREPEVCLQQSIRQKPENAELRFKLGMVYEKQGRPDDAIAEYKIVRGMIGETDRRLYELVRTRMENLQGSRYYPNLKRSD
ncbi:MAG: tetratricopeptide repeat protein [Desulfobacteraceae bacterium]|nr:MAG: tetratricopeptide repeat protein [Desulfobacteraceae bacterium]